MERHRLLLAGIVVVALLAAVMFSKPSITGYLPTETVSQGINIKVDNSQRFYLDSDELISLRGFALTGAVEGEGLVNVYLLNPKTSQRLLVASNDRPSVGGMAHITGLATISVRPGERLDLIESGDFEAGGSFVNECRDTCTLPAADFTSDKFVLDVIVEPGASAHISRLKFILANK